MMHIRAADGIESLSWSHTCVRVGPGRDAQLTLLTILSTLRHDPLVEWVRRGTGEDQAGMRESDEAERELEKVRSPQAHASRRVCHGPHDTTPCVRGRWISNCRASTR